MPLDNIVNINNDQFFIKKYTQKELDDSYNKGFVDGIVKATKETIIIRCLENHIKLDLIIKIVKVSSSEIKKIAKNEGFNINY
jgi:hypothetical protein